jgi:hypothetical protein
LQQASVAIQELDPDSEQYRRALQKLQYMNMRLAEQRGSGLRGDAAYRRKLLLKFGRT